MKIILLTWVFILGAASAQADDMPFYFFRFEPYQYRELYKSNQEAQKELCQITEKNCALESAEEFPEYAVLPLYEKPDLKSQVVGAFVNARSKEITSRGHYPKSAFASFVINRDGVKKNLTYYVSYSAEWAKATAGGALKVAFDEEDLHRKGFFAYVRADKAIPNTPESFVKNTPNGFRPRSDFNERWYGLANPDESGGVLWLRYKSDLRSPKFSKMEINEKLNPNLLDEILKQFSASKPFAKGKGFQPCRLMGGDLTIMYPTSGFITGFEQFNKIYKGKDLEERIKNSESDCNSTKSKQSIYEVKIPLEKIYKNGFLVEGVGFWGIEWKEFVEFQEAYPAFGSFYPRKYIDQSELDGK